MATFAVDFSKKLFFLAVDDVCVAVVDVTIDVIVDVVVFITNVGVKE